MDAIRRIVTEITFMCRLKNITVSDTLAAFVAHSIVLEHANLFPLDKELNESDVQDLVRMAVERLLAVDSPSLETIKMQVAFDTSKLDEVDALDATRGNRDDVEKLMLDEICEIRLKATHDVSALTALYRRIFNFLVLRAGLEVGANRPAEREIAAALESVFPRIGLKAFTMLAPEDKAAQLHELANIVLGIRLFNRSIGKGGVGIADYPAISRARVKEFLNLTGSELENVGTLCDQYTEVLSFRHSAPRQEKLATLSPAEQLAEAERIARLHDELANRRQFAAFIALLFDGLQQSAKHIAELERFHEKVACEESRARACLALLRQAVQGRAARVPRRGSAKPPGPPERGGACLRCRAALYIAMLGTGSRALRSPPSHLPSAPLAPPRSFPVPRRTRLRLRRARAGDGRAQADRRLARVGAEGSGVPALRRARQAVARLRGGGADAERAQADA
jgi:hypothetical protein